LFGKSFAKTTAKAINGDYEKGIKPSVNEQFKSEHKDEFSKKNFRNLQEEVDPAEVKDMNDAYNFHDAEF